MPALVSLLIGFEVTRRLMQLPRDLGAVYKLLAWGGGLLAVGLALAWIIPVNKNLWTPSYVILVGGIAVLALALCVWLADLLECKLLTDPFRIFGTNPLFIYCLSWICTATLMAVSVPVPLADGTVSLYTWLWQGLLPLLPPKVASLAFALLNVGFFWCVSWLLYRRNIVIKI
jgi:predicted acyltransferase